MSDSQSISSVSKVRKTLEDIGAVHPSRLIRFSDTTRDREIPVYQDSLTGVIFIDDFYVGDDEYSKGEYRAAVNIQSVHDLVDTLRRVKDFRPYYLGRRIIDFGCGAGSFVRHVSDLTLSAVGVELQDDFRNTLRAEGFACLSTLEDVDEAVDVIFMFHVLEHLPDPLETLKRCRELVSDNDGQIVVEVPHARDFLISHMKSNDFIKFTLWSQHLILHTRDSLRRLLASAGFTKVDVYGVQRYPLSNHLRWLSSGQPGGQRSNLAVLDDENLRRSYESTLNRIDATDTLVAVAW